MKNDATVDVLRALLVGTSTETAHARGPKDEPDWDYVGRFLVHHGLAGLAVARQKRAWETGTTGPLPDPVAAALEPHYLATAVQTQIRLETAGRVRRVLAEVGIPSVIFKGAALLQEGVYQTPGERLLEDVDVLIEPADVDHAIAALIEHGFSPWVPWERSRLSWLSAFALDDSTAPAGVRCTVDLHWSTRYGSLRFQEVGAADPLWRGADQERGLPAPEAHFVLISDHFLKHLRVVRHLRGLGDLARLAPRLRDPEALLTHARIRGSEGRLRTTVRALRDLYGVAFDAVVEAGLGPAAGPTPSERRYLGTERLLGTPGRPVGRLAGLLMRWRLDSATTGSRLRQLLDVLLPSEAWLRSRYPDSAGGAFRLRTRYGVALVAWALGMGPSPLSPNQETHLIGEDDAG